MDAGHATQVFPFQIGLSSGQAVHFVPALKGKSLGQAHFLVVGSKIKPYPHDVQTLAVSSQDAGASHATHFLSAV